MKTLITFTCDVDNETLALTNVTINDQNAPQWVSKFTSLYITQETLDSPMRDFVTIPTAVVIGE